MTLLVYFHLNVIIKEKKVYLIDNKTFLIYVLKYSRLTDRQFVYIYLDRISKLSLWAGVIYNCQLRPWCCRVSDIIIYCTWAIFLLF